MRLVVLLALALSVPALAAAPPRVIPASDLLIRQSSPTLDWRWRAAPEAATQPGLLKALRTEGLQDAAKAKAAAAKDAVSARKAGIPFRRYESITDWTRAADTQRLLALAGETYNYTGGAHGNTGYSAKIWDKTARRSIGIEALFSDWPRARKLIEPAFCRALAQEQTQRLGAAPTRELNACPKLAEQPIVPWGGLGTRALEFRVLVAPYVAGAYAEGSYLVTAPWPAGVRALVKPAYRDDLFGDAP
jgi:hypothetical protein